MRVPALLGTLLLAASLAPDRGGASGQAGEKRYFRGNTHTHTLWSDGDGAPELVVDWYREQGFDFLVLSDHNVLARGERWFPIEAEGAGRLTEARVDDLRVRFGAESVEVRTDELDARLRLATFDELRARFERRDEFLLIEGEEITDTFEQRPVHVNALNLAELIEPQRGVDALATIRNDVDAVAAQGERLGRATLAHLNHPNFHDALGADELAGMRGVAFFEVYNGHPNVKNRGGAGRPGTEELWDIALTRRLGELDEPLLYGLASDDAHAYHVFGPGKANPGRGWVMVRAAELTADALIEALQRGDFYASSGVTLRSVEMQDGEYRVEIARDPGVSYTTRFVGTRRTVDGIGPAGEVLLEVEGGSAIYRARGDELYVRAHVVSSRAHPNPSEAGELECAWGQPWIPRAE